MQTPQNCTPKPVGRKRTHLIYAKSQYKHLREPNEQVDRAFMRLIGKLKSQYLKLNECIYEYDSRHDASQSMVSLHTFLTRSLYLELICDYAKLEYYVAYDFEACHHEQAVRNMLAVYPLNQCLRYEPRKYGVAAYFMAVRAYQGDARFYYLSR